MTKICFYCVATHLGGAERSLLDLLVGLQKRYAERFTLHVLFPANMGPFVDKLKELNIAYSVLPMPKVFFRMSREKKIEAFLRGILSIPLLFGYVIQFLKFLRTEKPQVIYTTGIKCHVIAASLSVFHGAQVLWHLRDIVAPGFTLAVLTLLQRSFKPFVISNSKATLQSHRFSKGYPVVYNGFDTAAFSVQKNADSRRQFGAAQNSVVVGTMGVIARWKGQLDFIEMAARLIKQGYDVRFVIVGGKIYDTSGDEGFLGILKSTAKELGIQSQVYFAGYTDKPVLALQGMDIFVHTSQRPEPFGRVIVEAMGCGLPVVASNAGGVPEIIEHGQNGFLFSPGNVDDLTKQVKDLLDDSTKMADFSKKSRQCFERKFGLDQYVSGVVNVLTSFEGSLR